MRSQFTGICVPAWGRPAGGSLKKSKNYDDTKKYVKITFRKNNGLQGNHEMYINNRLVM